MHCYIVDKMSLRLNTKRQRISPRMAVINHSWIGLIRIPWIVLWLSWKSGFFFYLPDAVWMGKLARVNKSRILGSLWSDMSSLLTYFLDFFCSVIIFLRNQVTVPRPFNLFLHKILQNTMQIKLNKLLWLHVQYVVDKFISANIMFYLSIAYWF